MPTLKLNDEGHLVTEDGTVFELDGEAVKVEGAKTQADIDKSVEDRLARERAKYDELKKAAEQVPSLQKMVDESAAKLRDLEGEAERVKTATEQESAAQINKARQDAERYREVAERNAAELQRFQVKVAILGAAKDKFNDPETDLVSNLLNVHKREPVKGEDGKATGEFKDFYKLRFKNEDGVEVEDYLPVDKALEVWAESHPHHVRPTGASGSGGGTYFNHSNLKRSQMSIKQKCDYTEKHGVDAFEALPA